jgi:hypothetical protein
MKVDNSIDAPLRERSRAGRLFKPRLEKRDGTDFYFCVRPNTPQRGGRGPGKYHKIVDCFISSDGYLYVAYKLTNDNTSDEIGRQGFNRFVKLIPLPQE